MPSAYDNRLFWRPCPFVRRGRALNHREVRAVKSFLAFLAEFGRNKLHRAQNVSHDDTLRANQGDRSSPGFSYWRALVS